MAVAEPYGQGASVALTDRPKKAGADLDAHTPSHLNMNVGLGRALPSYPNKGPTERAALS